MSDDEVDPELVRAINEAGADVTDEEPMLGFMISPEGVVPLRLSDSELGMEEQVDLVQPVIADSLACWEVADEDLITETPAVIDRLGHLAARYTYAVTTEVVRICAIRIAEHLTRKGQVPQHGDFIHASWPSRIDGDDQVQALAWVMAYVTSETRMQYARTQIAVASALVPESTINCVVALMDLMATLKDGRASLDLHPDDGHDCP